MTNNSSAPQNKENLPEISLFSAVENLFDWNLIALVSVWIFLLSTFFLIFAS